MATPVIRVDISGALAGLQRVREDQIPFATAKALTNTAQLCVDVIRAKLPSQFTLRNTFTARGVGWKMATKANLTAWVTFDRWYMYLQEVGGVRVGRRKMIAIPLDPALRRRIPANMRPKVLMAQADLAGMSTGKSKSRAAAISQSYGTGFLIRSGGRAYIAIRTARSVRKGMLKGQHDPNVRVLYVLVPDVKIPPRLKMLETCRATVQREFPNQFAKAMEYAVSSAR